MVCFHTENTSIYKHQFRKIINKKVHAQRLLQDYMAYKIIQFISVNTYMETHPDLCDKELQAAFLTDVALFLGGSLVLL